MRTTRRLWCEHLRTDALPIVLVAFTSIGPKKAKALHRLEHGYADEEMEDEREGKSDGQSEEGTEDEAD